jgi:D-glycero-D-manno-heptose 1,7-bisphosphate phosphatase
LREAGFLLVMVTNQPEIARGNMALDTLETMNGHLQTVLKLDAVKVCPHDDGENCHCRKPKAGLLREVAADFQVDLSMSFMVGDRWRDVDAGKAAGCKTVFIDYGYLERQPESPDFIASSLDHATKWILEIQLSLGEKNAEDHVRS